MILKLRAADFRTLTRRRTLSTVTAEADRIFGEARSLFRAHWDGKPVRLIGCGVSNVEPGEHAEPDLFAPPETAERKRNLAETIDQIEDRFGEGVVTRARLCPPGAARLVSEALTPAEGWFDTDGMSRGEPGLPAAFRWKERLCRVQQRLRSWKQVRPEPTGQMYLRRHYYELLMDDGSTWTVYCLRQAGRPGHAAPRWFLYRVG
jgi:nucleotidyltransferase/DNA polymerase involved in DNA repair